MLSVRVPLAALLLGTAACRTVQPVRQPAQFIPQANPDVVVVVFNDNSQVPVSQPRMSGDTLLGTWLGVGDPVVAPLSQIQRIDAVQRNKKRTTLMIAGLTAMTAAGVYAMMQAATGGRPTCDYSYTAGGQVPQGRCTGMNQPQ
jgi:hypothetical protein